MPDNTSFSLKYESLLTGKILKSKNLKNLKSLLTGISANSTLVDFKTVFDFKELKIIYCWDIIFCYDYKHLAFSN